MYFWVIFIYFNIKAYLGVQIPSHIKIGMLPSWKNPAGTNNS